MLDTVRAYSLSASRKREDTQSGMRRPVLDLVETVDPLLLPARRRAGSWRYRGADNISAADRWVTANGDARARCGSCARRLLRAARPRRADALCRAVLTLTPPPLTRARRGTGHLRDARRGLDVDISPSGDR
jgi:hypothetical protein